MPKLQNEIVERGIDGMAAHILRKIYAPEFMVRKELQRGEIPSTREAYTTALGVAWASILETFLISLISMADTIMVSSVGDAAIAAVGLCTQPRFIVMSLVSSMNVAITSIAARRKGERDPDGAVSCLKQGLILCFGLSLVISALFYPFAERFLWFSGAQDDTIGLATDYFRILLIGIPINCLSLTISAAQRGIGNTRASMNINLCSNIVNLVFNYFLIGGKLGFPALGVSGAAWATVIGWVVGLGVAVASVLHRGAYLNVWSREGWRFDKRTLGAMYKVASGSFLEQICMRVGFFTYAKIIAGLGTTLFAAHQIVMNIMNLSFCFGEGFGIASSSLVGQNLGAKRPDLSIVYGKVCQRMSLITSSILFLVLTLFGRQMLTLFTKDDEIISVGSTIMVIAGVILFGQASQMIIMGSLRGAGDTKYTAVVSLICIMILRPGVAYLMAYPLGFGLIGAWISFLLDQYLRLLLTYIRFSSGRWMKIQL
ncbi:MATE family efflux transporter [Ruminococcaceae bacterium OttesenSCG-928-L11]|nr:MATE family efflux transporter [Ruminococcaceae bacterium OttesenSCG-928-L11]